MACLKGDPVLPVSVPGAEVSPGARIWSLLNRFAMTTTSAGKVVIMLPPSPADAAMVIVCAFLVRALMVFTPAASAPLLSP